MKKVYAINGSPRKNRNTAKMLDKALEGVKSVFPYAYVERINLYDLDFTGCKSCFACKRKDEKFLKTCALNDGLTPVLEKLKEADGVIIGSPIYFHAITSRTHAFYERLFFPYMTYRKNYEPYESNKMATACIYTMNVRKKEAEASDYRKRIEQWEVFLGWFFSKPLVTYAFNTYQFDDYSKYVCEAFSEKDKASYREKQFPIDLKNAYKLGAALLKQEN